MVWEKLEAIVGQLRRSSAALDRINALRDQPWVVATETTRHMMLIFQGGGKLLVTVNGDVHYGRYEVIEGAGSVLLDLDGKPRLYKHGFIDDALMVLKLQGHGFEPLVLVNEAKVPDLDVEGYLERVYLGPGRERARVEEVTTRPESIVFNLIEGKELRAWRESKDSRFHRVTLDDQPAPDTFYLSNRVLGHTRLQGVGKFKSGGAGSRGYGVCSRREREVLGAVGGGGAGVLAFFHQAGSGGGLWGGVGALRCRLAVGH